MRSRLLWLIGARAAVVTLLLGSAILAQIRSPGSLPVDPFFFLIALTYALTAVYGLLARKAAQQPWIVDVQLAGDGLIVSGLVHMTGGITSIFSTLYTLPIIAASTMRSRRGGALVGVLSAVSYVALVAAQYAGLGSAGGAGAAVVLPPPRMALFVVGLNVFGFFAVSGLSGYLAEGLRRADERLEQTSNQLSDLQALSQHVIDSLASGLATTDVSGVIVTFNRAAAAIVGADAAAVVGRPIGEVLAWPHGLGDVFGAGLPDPVLPRAEFAFTRPDGRGIELGLSTAVLHTPRGATGFIFTFRDVTDARRDERQARAQQRLAAIGEMAAGIAREIRNPLASMAGSIQILRQDLPLSGEQSQLMDIVIRESERLNDTIRSLLAYARPHRRTASVVDLRTAVTETATLLRHSPERLERHDVAVDVPDEPVWCEADEGQIRQVVWNLAINGLRAMPSGGTLRMRVAAETGEAGSRVTLAVADTGVGIAPEDVEGILQPFRGGFARGAGLGLSIVNRIVTDYGGQLRVASQPGAGTTMFVGLPAVEGLPLVSGAGEGAPAACGLLPSVRAAVLEPAR